MEQPEQLRKASLNSASLAQAAIGVSPRDATSTGWWRYELFICISTVKLTPS